MLCNYLTCDQNHGVSLTAGFCTGCSVESERDAKSVFKSTMQWTSACQTDCESDVTSRGTEECNVLVVV